MPTCVEYVLYFQLVHCCRACQTQQRRVEVQDTDSKVLFSNLPSLAFGFSIWIEHRRAWEGSRAQLLSRLSPGHLTGVWTLATPHEFCREATPTALERVAQQAWNGERECARAG